MTNAILVQSVTAAQVLLQILCRGPPRLGGQGSQVFVGEHLS
jgi:hypothetical protein